MNTAFEQEAQAPSRAPMHFGSWVPAGAGMTPFSKNRDCPYLIGERAW
jgi:hypothetical protein